MKFAMGAETLSHLSKQTSSAHEDLGALVKRLAVAAEPLEMKFNGNARAVFNQFNARTDQIAVDFDAALAAVLGGIQGQDAAFIRGEQQMVDATSSAQAGVCRSTPPASPGVDLPSPSLMKVSTVMPASRYGSGSGSAEFNQADRRDYDIPASQSAQDQFNAVAVHLETLIDQRSADVNAAMTNYAADGISEAYAAKEVRWRNVGAEVKGIIHTTRSSLASNDDSATQAMQQAKSAVDAVGRRSSFVCHLLAHTAGTGVLCLATRSTRRA